ncbi:hypothetical protein E8M01_08040 [Phreatobacter stygius]|uniref:Uncharacterized protein n=2 Tax=Phreatobacter stygius TaxID=1940610 RepID=A0A4D7B2B1_9HYPH|nr:hypothetical protein E8M01_08040 [Phreatobacter stygius]
MSCVDGKADRLATWLAILIAAAAPAVPGTALARPADDIAAARSWGILGTWRLDCRAPPSRDNGSLTYAVRGGRLVHPRDFGSERDELDVLSGRVLSNGRFEFVIQLPPSGQRRRFTLTKGDDGRIRVIDNVVDGTSDYSIRDGAFVTTGKPSRWQTRCNDQVGSNSARTLAMSAKVGRLASLPSFWTE